METLRDISIGLFCLTITICWAVDLAVSTFGPHSLFELWHREAHFLLLLYPWFVTARLVLYVALIIGSIWMKVHN
jgi:hypothetical protein